MHYLTAHVLLERNCPFDSKETIYILRLSHTCFIDTHQGQAWASSPFLPSAPSRKSGAETVVSH